MNIAAGRAFKRHGTTVKPSELSTSIVTECVLRLSLNPMYLGMILIPLGIAILVGSLAPFAVCAMFALLMRYRFVRIEERTLVEQFGTEWRRYSTGSTLVLAVSAADPVHLD